MCLAGIPWLSFLSSTLLLTFKLLALKVIPEFCITPVKRRDLTCSPTISPLMDYWEKGEGEKSSPHFHLISYLLDFFSFLFFLAHFPSPVISPRVVHDHNTVLFSVRGCIFLDCIKKEHTHKTALFFTVEYNRLQENEQMEMLSISGPLNELQTPEGLVLWWLSTHSASEAGSRPVPQGTADNDIHCFNRSMDLCL